MCKQCYQQMAYRQQRDLHDDQDAKGAHADFILIYSEAYDALKDRHGLNQNT